MKQQSNYQYTGSFQAFACKPTGVSRPLRDSTAAAVVLAEMVAMLHIPHCGSKLLDPPSTHEQFVG